jgi:hypothetical protein
MCNGGSREDERHFVFECGRYSAIRQRYQDLFGGEHGLPTSDEQVQGWMNPDEERAPGFWPRLNAFLFECWRERSMSADQ